MGKQQSAEELAKQQVEEPKNQLSTSEVRPQVEDKKKPPTDQEGRPQLQEVRKLPHIDDDTAPKAMNTSNAKQPVNNHHDHTQRKEVHKKETVGPKSYIIPAKELTITWSEEPRYWSWLTWKEAASNTNIEVAHLLNVCWLEVHGKFDVSKLSPGVVYETVFVVMLKDPAYGWEIPVNLKLASPQGQTQQHQEKLVERIRGQWIELHVGDFTRTNNETGEVDFSLFEYHGGQWKRGLIIKEAIVRPKISMG